MFYFVRCIAKSLFFFNKNGFLIIYSQVFINYGTIPNNRLLRLYSFVLDSNPYNSYNLVLAMEIGVDDTIKTKFLSVAGLDTTITIPLTLTDPLPQKVLQY